MDASSTRRARLTRLALCTAAVAAVAAFTGEARADNGLSGLVSGTVSGPVSGTLEQLPAPVAEPLGEVVSSVAPTVDAAVPPAVAEVVGDATQLPGEIATPPVVTGVLQHVVPARGGGSNARDAGPENAPRATSAPETGAPTEVSAPIAAETAAAPTETARRHAGRASRPSSDLTPAARTAAPARRPRLSVSHTPFSPVPTPVSRDVAPNMPIATITTADPRPAHVYQTPSSPLPIGSELPGFDALLPPLAAFALLLAVPLGLFALTAPGARGAGLHPAVAVLRSADVRFRLVRPG